MRVLIIADSTAMWIRPPRDHVDELTYIEHMRKSGIHLDVISTPGMTSKEILNIYWNELGAKFYDIYIISVGINDLTPRSYPQWMWKINNKLLIRESILSKFYRPFYGILTNHYVQKIFSKYSISRPWVAAKFFKRYLLKFQELVLKESDSKIIYLSLPMASQRVSSLLYGIDENIVAYKKEIHNLIDNTRVFEIDIDTLFREDKVKYNQEGIHYSADGHKVVFDALIKKIRHIGYEIK